MYVAFKEACMKLLCSLFNPCSKNIKSLSGRRKEVGELLMFIPWKKGGPAFCEESFLVNNNCFQSLSSAKVIKREQDLIFSEEMTCAKIFIDASSKTVN